MNWQFETYSLEQWIILFFIYAFLGYIWEVAYVSVKNHKLTDRGFLYGPIVPIYGSGALIVLLATIPFRENLWLVFFCGMLAATALEYVTGWVMEKLFAVRYWDYSVGRFFGGIAEYRTDLGRKNPVSLFGKYPYPAGFCLGDNFQRRCDLLGQSRLGFERCLAQAGGK